MRILSPFKDYYDCAMGLGQDTDLVYKRFPEETKLLKYSFPWCYENVFVPTDKAIVSQVVIGFCGSIYPVFKLRNPRSLGVEECVCFTLSDVDDFAKAIYHKREYEIFCVHKSKDHHRWRGPLSRAWRKYHWEEVFAKFDDYSKSGQHRQFFKEPHPIFVVEKSEHTYRDPSTLTHNAMLKPYEFYRVRDPYQAFQDISMYLGNMAEPRKPIPEISDEVMAEAKGFDKFSFRKQKEKR